MLEETESNGGNSAIHSCGSDSSYLCNSLYSFTHVNINVTDANDVPVIETDQEREIKENDGEGVILGSKFKIKKNKM